MVPAVARFHSLLARNARLLKLLKKYSEKVQDTVASLRTYQAELQPVLARNSASRPIHPVARLRQSKGRWYSTQNAFNAAIRRFTSSAGQRSAGQPGGIKYDRASLPKSRVSSAVNSLPGRSPFAHTLRPNLTGGALPRSAGGYGLGGSARYFSHMPAAPAQVVHNVSQAVRAFLISGNKAQFDGIDPLTGGKRYRAISALQDEANRKMKSVPRATPGSFIDFSINPTITALTSLEGLAGFSQNGTPKQSLNTDGLLDVLSVDFSRALKDLSAVLNDLKRLASLGDLPLTYGGSSIRVHFPGCDADFVAMLCNELGVTHGLVQQDEDFDAFVGTDMALLFPFAPSKTWSECSFFEKPVEFRRLQDPIDWRTMISAEKSEASLSVQSDAGFGFEHVEVENPWLSSPSGYESLHHSELSSIEHLDKHSPQEYQGVEGMYRFMEACQPSVY